MSGDGQQGFALTELLVTMAIFMVVMFATLNTLDVFTKQSERTNQRNDTEQSARVTVDQMARRLRNLASPTPSQPLAVDKATDYDLVFQSVDPAGPNTGQNLTNVRRLRYCLNSANPASGTVWLQTQTWVGSTTPPAPSTASCPDNDPRWATTGIVATHVVNRIAGNDRPIWLTDAAATSDISFVRVTLILDIDAAGPAAESTLSSGVFLRNQNRAPVAGFTATPTGGRHVILNGSLSQDPEGEPLVYAWFDGTTPIGAGVTKDYLSPSAAVRQLSLKVTDPGGLVGESAVQAVQVR